MTIAGPPTGKARSRDEYPGPVRVMVVDDSAVIRGLLTRALESDPDIKVVSSVGNGEMAIKAIKHHKIDVVVLDVEMPVMDGLTALPLLIQASPESKVVMASTLTRRGADITLQAIKAGASEYVPKPSSTREIHSADEFRQELLAKVKALGPRGRRSVTSGRASADQDPSMQPDRQSAIGNRRSGVERTPVIVTRPMPRGFAPGVIAIGSSTGGPQALFEVLGHLGARSGRPPVTVPILITQHMPATFTSILADHISRQCGLEAIEAAGGEALKPGRVIVAPGQYHLVVENQGGVAVARINQDPPENFCRPSVDPMLRSIVKCFGARTLAVMLTGMGHDGLEGCRQVACANGSLLAQDEATSVIWGMPGAVANAGLCNAVLPLSEIGPRIRKLIRSTCP